MSSTSPQDLISQFTRQFAALAGPGFDALNIELRQQIRTAAQAAFMRMDFVPREDFEAQKAVLLRTRQKLEQLEQQLAALEARLAADDKPQ